MKLFLTILALAAGALPLAASQAPPPASTTWETYSKEQTSIRQRGTEALQREEARSHADLCSQPAEGGQAALTRCLLAEGRTTDQNYRTYVRAVGALLRLPTPGQQSSQSTGRLPFDVAENTWQTYREQSCASMTTQWGGGDQAPVASADCKLKLTWNHLKELADLYADLWH